MSQSLTSEEVSLSNQGRDQPAITSSLQFCQLSWTQTTPQAASLLSLCLWVNTPTWQAVSNAHYFFGHSAMSRRHRWPQACETGSLHGRVLLPADINTSREDRAKVALVWRREEIPTKPGCVLGLEVQQAKGEHPLYTLSPASSASWSRSCGSP